MKHQDIHQLLAVQKEHPKLPKWHQTRANPAVGELCHHPMTTEGSGGGAPGSSHQAELAPDLSWAKGRAGKAKPHTSLKTSHHQKQEGRQLLASGACTGSKTSNQQIGQNLI